MLNQNIHIGNHIAEVAKMRGMSVAALARAVPCTRQNIYDIFNRSSLDIEKLYRFSQILEHDFIAELKHTKRYLVVIETDTLTLLNLSSNPTTNIIIERPI
ncbi:MAG: helix-turn-helix transcriptional regulator [Prevotellaceae bacterium]|jgi:transcriptional regulator with XRE-family HTH domain|nr:helix-turn-helix transcriptional regulator [Prevotellaceae bacterium]